MEHVYGHQAGIIVTVLILCIAFASLFAVVLGYSRVPYAAAIDGNFFKVFAKLHPTKNFPYVSLIVLCAVGFVFSLFMRLGDVITSILAMRIVIQFIGQAVGVTLLRKKLVPTIFLKKCGYFLCRLSFLFLSGYFFLFQPAGLRYGVA